MEHIRWTNQYIIGVKNIDAQHQRLIELINQFNFCCKNNHDKENIHRILNELVEYAKEHFATEEDLLEVNSYPLIVEHIKEHTKFIKKITFFFNIVIKNNEKNITEDILKYLHKWVEEHLLVQDKKYADTILVKK